MLSFFCGTNNNSEKDELLKWKRHTHNNNNKIKEGEKKYSDSTGKK